MLIGMTALIAYWWATQGLLSAILHLVCVVAAGTLAFAFWEPLTAKIMNGGTFDNYAWGVSLIGVPGSEHLLFNIGKAFERELQTPVRPVCERLSASAGTLHIESFNALKKELALPLFLF